MTDAHGHEHGHETGPARAQITAWETAGTPAELAAARQAIAARAQANLTGQADAAIAKAISSIEPDSAEKDIDRALAAEWKDLPAAAKAAALAGEPGPEPGPLPPETWTKTDPPPRDWIIPGILPAGRLAALYGTGGAGKSTLALQLAAAVMHGGPPLKPMPGMRDPASLEADHPILRPIPGDPGPVLWLTWEDEISELIRRWRMAHHAGAIGPDFPDPDLLRLIDMRKLGGPLWSPDQGRHVGTVAGWTEAGRRFLASLDGHRLAVIDPLAAAFASSEIDRSLVRRFTSALDGEAERSGCAVLLIGHPSQAGAEDGGKGYSGSTDWQASVRAFLSLERSKDTGHVFTKDDGKQAAAAPAHRLANPKQSYSHAAGHTWLVRHWKPAHVAAPPADPAELAWFAARAGDAAKAFEVRTACEAGRKARTIVPIDEAAGGGRGSKADGDRDTSMDDVL